ncbi:hypothetical protein EV292_10833 [Sphingomonas sp. BK235]|nr:hypothetical protein EV292_10833 [Sphingomonas sp. BK235]
MPPQGNADAARNNAEQFAKAVMKRLMEGLNNE